MMLLSRKYYSLLRKKMSVATVNCTEFSLVATSFCQGMFFCAYQVDMNLGSGCFTTLQRICDKSLCSGQGNFVKLFS